MNKSHAFSFAIVIGTLFAPLDAMANTTINDNCSGANACLEASNSGTGDGIDVSNAIGGGYGINAAGGTAGVLGSCSDLSGGDGVIGTCTTGDGVHGSSGSTSSSGVSGLNTSGGSGGHGVYGKISSAGPGTAIYGENNSASSGAYAGYFDGNVTVTGTFSNPSDVRLKKNIQPMAGALDQLLKLRGVTFEWTDPADHGSLTGTQRGFIAQEVEKVFPTWVQEDGKGIKSVDMRGLEALEVESLRTLKGENDALRKQASLLEERVSALESARRPVAGGVFGSASLGVGGLAIAGAVVMSSRRKRSGERS
jgi:Chaperone of endosialidase